MSSKTRNRKTRTNTGTTGSTRTLRSVSDQGTAATVRTDTEDRLWTALHAYPNNAAPFLAGAANIGRSTAAKILAKWAKDGGVTRTPGIAEEGRRAADLWTITDTNIDTDVETDSTEPTPDGESDLADTTQADATAPEPTDTEPTDETTDGGSTEPSDTAADHARNATHTGATHTGATDTEATGPTEAEPVGAEATKPAADRAATDAPADSGDRDDGGEKPARLAPGTLRGMVEDYLREHPEEEFGPTAIAKALGGKSSGAVSNALDKLVDADTAAKTKESPKRFALAPAERAAASTATK